MISIIVPIYNAEKYIKKNIESILKQTYKDYELIIINDGSTDKSIEIIKQFKDNRIKIYNKKNEGVSSARNLGIKKATKPYLLFIDADDYLEPNMLEEIIKIADNKKNDITICGFFSETINGTKEKFYCKEKYYNNKKAIKKDLIKLYNNDLMYNSWNKLYKKEIIDKYNIEFPKIIFGEDNAFNLEYLTHCNTLYNIDKCLYHYVRELKNSITMKYIPNFFDIRLNENKAFIKLFEYYQINSTIYSKYIAKRFIERTIGCLENLHRKNTLTLKEKLQETKRIISNEETKKYKKKYKTKNKIIKLALITYEFKNPTFAYAIGWIFNITKKIFPALFNRTKNKR